MAPKTTYADRLTDIQRVIAQFERLPEKAQSYVVGYIEGRVDSHFPTAQQSAERPGT